MPAEQPKRTSGSKRTWIQEERRRTLGDWVVFCGRCGHTLRYFEQHEDELAADCPHCGGVLTRRCPSCDARFRSAFQVECEECGAEIRPKELFGSPIRKPEK